MIVVLISNDLNHAKVCVFVASLVVALVGAGCSPSPIAGTALTTSTSTGAGGMGMASGGGGQDADPPKALTKSPKRGSAYNMVQEEDFRALEPGVSWWYNWYFRTDASDSSAAENTMEFVPMLWGGNTEADYDALEAWVLNHPNVQHVLVMNEPNLVDQANLRPEQAVPVWRRYETFQAQMAEKHGRTIAIVGPAITWGTMSGYEDPVVWMDAFLSAFESVHGRPPRIDVLAFHWYDYGLDEQLSRLERYGKRFWVTEMANWHKAADWTIDTPEKQLETMKDMVKVCETRSDVERYAWFMGRWKPDPHHTSLFQDEPGKLTPLGESYLAQPWVE